MPKKANGEHRWAEQDLYLRDRAIAASSNGIVISDPNQPDNPLIYVTEILGDQKREADDERLADQDAGAQGPHVRRRPRGSDR